MLRVAFICTNDKTRRLNDSPKRLSTLSICQPEMRTHAHTLRQL